MAKTEKNVVANETAITAGTVSNFTEENYKDLSGRTLKELLTIKDALLYLIQYYDNYAQANTGNYQYDTKAIYESAKNQSHKYGKALVRLIQDIKDKVDGELYK